MKLSEKAPFKIAGATYHNWIGGQPGVYGTNLIIGLEGKENVTFNSVYFINRIEKPYIETKKGKEYLVVNISISKPIGNKGKNENPDMVTKEIVVSKTDFPFKLKENEAVIKYMIGEKVYYYKVSEIKKTKVILYP
jgi:hypothetical protein